MINTWAIASSKSVTVGMATNTTTDSRHSATMMASSTLHQLRQNADRPWEHMRPATSSARIDVTHTSRPTSVLGNFLSCTRCSTASATSSPALSSTIST